MKKIILISILMLFVFISTSKAGILIGNSSDPVREKIVCDNGDKLIHYEARVLFADAKHKSGIDSLTEKKEKEVVVPVCNCSCVEDDITISTSYEWTY